MKNYTAETSEHNAGLDQSTKLTMLVVDDSKVIRLALNKILKTDYTVLQANDGEEAWTLLSENEQISAVFSDVSMPILDGFGLLERVRSSDEERIANIPFIIITANEDDAKFVNKVNQAGGTDLVTKPFKTNEIMQCISTHVLSREDTAVPMSEYQEKAVQESMLNTQEVTSLLGIDDELDSLIDQPLSADDVSLPPETVAAKPEPAAEQPSPEITLENSSSFSLTEDLYEPTQVEFTIDEEFFSELDKMEEVATDITEPVIPQESLQSAPPVNRVIAEEELALEPIEDSSLASPLADITDSAIDVFIPDDQSSQFTSDTILSSTDSSLTHADKARQATETSQIRAELSRLREQELSNGTYSQDLDFSITGKISSFFNRLKLIIGKAVGRNRKS